jgi:hypothetical protein
MQADLGSTYAGSMFTAGYIIGQWPSALVLSSGRIPPRFWFPFCMVVWGFLTLGLACTSTSYSQTTTDHRSRPPPSPGLGHPLYVWYI